MKTLKELIIELKIRKGPSHAISRFGACWELVSKLRHYGGDGIGNSRPNMVDHLRIRHYRNGSVTATLVKNSWHQNTGGTSEEEAVNLILDMTTVEDIYVFLVGKDCGVEKSDLDKFLINLGLVQAIPSPDESE